MKRFLALLIGGLLACAPIAQADLRATGFSGTFVGQGVFDSIALDSTNKDVLLVRDAANVLAQKNGTTSQELRIYGTTTGTKYLKLAHDGSNAQIDSSASAGGLFLGALNASSIVLGGGSHATGVQLRTVQQTVPTCTTNCGTSPAVVGTDTSGIVTMGGTGVPASGWVVTFNGTWNAAPSCVVQSALITMVVGKMPIAVQTTTTTMTVTTNGTAPANSDKYAYHCIGVA